MTKELYLKPAIRIRPFITGDELLQNSLIVGEGELDGEPWAKETDLDYDVEIKNVWSE